VPQQRSLAEGLVGEGGEEDRDGEVRREPRGVAATDVLGRLPGPKTAEKGG
jgi:hypothetical protein